MNYWLTGKKVGQFGKELQTATGHGHSFLSIISANHSAKLRIEVIDTSEMATEHTPIVHIYGGGGTRLIKAFV